MAADALQMQAMLSMASGMAGFAMPSHSDGPHVPGVPNIPQVDPSMAQAYVQMFQYLQQGLSQQALGAAAAAAAMPSPMPFPGMTPYTAPSAGLDPTIAVSVEGMKFQYQLTEDDLHKVFSRYGVVKSIRVDEAGAAAQISFAQAQDAQAAMNDLNGKVLNGLEGTLRIQWVNNGVMTPNIPAPYSSMPFPGWGFPPAVPSAGLAAPGIRGISPGATDGVVLPSTGTEKSPHVKGVRKFTCRFLIGIENDKEFQVARRIIGAKGANMKRIVKQTEAKLRLRGVGSGYFEGAGQKESSEPLQLCVSCTSPEGYKTAVMQVEELLKRVYEEYKQFCRDAGHPVPDLAINLSENQLVYSSRDGGGVPTSSGGSRVEVDAGGSPKKDGKRNRRARGKREGGAAGGDLDRGEAGPNAPPIEEIEKLIDDRNEARRANNFSEADRIREYLHKRGVALMDEPGGRGRGTEVTTWRYWRD